MAWISVRERMPEEGVCVLAQPKVGRMEVMCYMPDRFGERHITAHWRGPAVSGVLMVFAPCQVTHWMPLPEPPDNECANGGRDG